MRFLPFAFALAALPVWADEMEDAFVEANMLGIFYHELGHALIHSEGVPIFGQEEDAADVFSIFLIDSLYEEESAVSLAYDAALGFLGEAIMSESHDVPWWDVHGPDEQRFYNTVCLFYGANPDARGEFAADMELPIERADYCPEEFDQAWNSWGMILDELAERKDGHQIDYKGEPGLVGEMLAEEVAALNSEFQLSHPLTVVFEDCGEANAFYDPNARQITMCREFEGHLRQLEDYFQ